MILAILTGKWKRLICRIWGHRIGDYGESLRDSVYDPGDFCERCGHWL